VEVASQIFNLNKNVGGHFHTLATSLHVFVCVCVFVPACSCFTEGEVKSLCLIKGCLVKMCGGVVEVASQVFNLNENVSGHFHTLATSLRVFVCVFVPACSCFTEG